MDVYTTEEQQVEAIKNWLRENGKSVVLGAIIGLGALYGWRYYQTEQQILKEQASDAYSQVVTMIAENPENAEKAVNEFIASNQTGYADLVALQLAKSFVEKDDLVKAAAQLRLVQASDDVVLQAIANLRLARIEIEQGHLDAAINELNKVTSESWKAQVEELRGDIALQQNNVEQAIAAYEASIAAAPSQVVQMKLDNLSR